MADTMKCLFLNIISSQILFSILFFCNYVSQYSLLILPYKRVLDQLKHGEMAFPTGSTWINDILLPAVFAYAYYGTCGT